MLRRKRGATPRLRCCQAGPENVSLKLSLAPNLVAQPARRIAERESGRQAAFRVPQSRGTWPLPVNRKDR